MPAAAITVTTDTDDAPVVLTAPAHADREFKSFPAASVVSSDEHPGEIEAVVSVFDVIDKGKDKIKPGFFTKSLERKLPKGVWGHNWDAPIAKTLEARELAAGDPLLPDGLKGLGGLYIKGQFNLDTQRGREAYSDIKFGIIDEFSIGYRTVKAKKDEKSGVRELIEGDLFEWSPVLVGMNDRTALLSIKSADGTEDVTGVTESVAPVTDREDYEVVPEAKVGKPINAARAAMWRKTITSMRAMLDQMEADIDAAHPEPGKADDASIEPTADPEPETKGVVPYKAGPILEADAWDGAAAEARVRKWASSDGSGDKDAMDWPKLRQAYAYIDADGEGSSFGAYHLLHHDVEDGTLKVARRGVFAAAVIVQGGRGGGAAFVARIGQAAADGIRAHMGKHYKDMNMTAPWDGGKSAEADPETPEADPTQPPEAKADEPPAKVHHDDVAKLFTKYMIEFEAPRLGLSTIGSH